MAWWRAHDKAVDNAKLQRLPPEQFKAWFNLCCLASANHGILPSLGDIAFKLRVNKAKAENVIETLRNAKLINDEQGQLKMHDWDEYQYKSDVSTERVKRYRKRQRNVSDDQQRNVSSNVASAVSETHQSTETEKNSEADASSVCVLPSSSTSLEPEEPQREQACGRKRRKKTTLPENFVPDRAVARQLGWDETRIEQQIQAFFDSAKAHARVYADWAAAWRNWCNSPFQQQNQTVNGHGRHHANSLLQAIDRIGEKLEGATDPAPGEDPFLGLPPR